MVCIHLKLAQNQNITLRRCSHFRTVFSDAGCAESGCRRTFRCCNICIQVAPVRVLLFDQIEFPDSVHLAYFLFSLLRGMRVWMPFDIDELIDGVLAGDAANQVAFVVQDAIDEVVGFAYVESSVAFAGEDVGAVAGDHDCWLPYARFWAGEFGRFEILIRRIGMALVVGPTVLERTLALPKAVGKRIVSMPLMNSHAAAGIGTVDGAWSILPEAPGVPMSPAP
jgi:hypothetical protein